MLKRVYSVDHLTKHPTYKGCSVCTEWHNFQVFAKWFSLSNHKYGWHLDKDVVVKGNKHYSPEFCSFIPQEVNKLTNKKKASRGDLPLGVTTTGRKFRAQCNDENGVRKYIGSYTTVEEAFSSYKKYKESTIKQVAEKYVDALEPRVYNALINYRVEISD